MTDFFKKSDQRIPVRDIIFISETAKFQVQLNKWQENKKISSSIRRAQQKMQKKIIFENADPSQAEWFKKNIRAQTLTQTEFYLKY